MTYAADQRVITLEEAEAREDGWPDPDMRLISDGREPPPEFPIETMRSAASWIKKQAEQRSCPVDYVAWSLLACAAAAIGNSREAHVWGDFYVPSALWIALMGNPGIRKTPAVRPVLHALRQAEKEISADFDDRLARYEAQKIEAEVARDQWEAAAREHAEKGNPVPDRPQAAVAPDKPVRPRLVISDSTTEALIDVVAGTGRAVLQFRDELAGLIGGMDRYNRGSGDKPLYLEAYNGDPYQKDRKSDGAVYIPRLNVSILGTIQPDRFSELMLTNIDDGFLCRFIIIWPEDVPPRRPRPYIHDDIAERIFTALASLEMHEPEDGPPVPKTIPFSPGAQDGFERFQLENYHKTCGSAGLMASFRGKLDGLVCRLAMILELIEWAAHPGRPEPAEISAESFAFAALLAETYCVPMARQAYSDAGVTPTERHAILIAKRIRRDRIAVINRRQVQLYWNLPGVHKKTEPVKAAFEHLENAGWGRYGNKPTGGRPTVDFTINPKVFAHA